MCSPSRCAGLVETIQAGDFFGEMSMFQDERDYPAIQTCEASGIYRLPLDIIRNIPILNWKLFERHQKRIKRFNPEAYTSEPVELSGSS